MACRGSRLSPLSSVHDTTTKAVPIQARKDWEMDSQTEWLNYVVKLHFII